MSRKRLNRSYAVLFIFFAAIFLLSNQAVVGLLCIGATIFIIAYREMAFRATRKRTRRPLHKAPNWR